MRFFYKLLIAALSLTSSYAATIQFSSTFLGVVGGQRQFRYTYTDLDTPLQANQALEIQFDQNLYGTLSNPSAPSSLSVVLFQPNNPPGLPGLYSALALTSTPAPISNLTVDFIFLGAGNPGPQPFQINQFDAQGGFVATLTSGVTTNVVPEPGGLMTAGVVVLVGCVMQFRRRT